MGRQPTKADSQTRSCYHASMSGENDHNLINFIAATVEAMRDQMATKDDLAAVKAEMATKDNLARVESRLDAKLDQMATKNDLNRLEATMHGEFEQVHIRFDSTDRRVDTRMGQIETDVSRLRSVVYLLVKDKPDMLRLLGQPTPRENLPQT